MPKNDNQHLFNNQSSGMSGILIMLFFYLLTGVTAFFSDIFINHTNYGNPQLKWWVIAFLTGVLISGVNILIESFTWAGRRLNTMIKDMLADYPTFGLLILVVVGAISEEIIFRGLGLGWLTPKTGPWPALGITSIIFGFLHGFFRPPFILWSFTALIWGLILGLLMLKSGFILVPVVVHATINLFGVTWLRYGNA